MVDATPPLPSPDRADRLLNREMSWLEFNRRVLELAEDERTPLLERAKFLAIFTSNLDEFFQIRVAGVMQQHADRPSMRSVDGLTPLEQLTRIRRRVRELMTRHSTAFLAGLAPGLREEGIAVVGIGELGSADLAHLQRVFDERVFPVLTPLAVDPARPFPFVSNLSMNLAVVVRRRGGEERFARVKVPGILPRFVTLADGVRFVPLEDLIAARLPRLFDGLEVVESHPFRVTRNADFEIEEEEAPDLLDAIQSELLRRRFGRVVRLEIHPSMPGRVRAFLRNELQVGADDVYEIDAPLDLTGLWQVHGLDRPDLADEPWRAVTPPDLVATREAADLFATLRERTVLVHHPYESFSASVERFVATAADDPKVLAIKQTLYRTSEDSPIVAALVRAAEAGKQVVALVELKARFDEAANIRRARRLEEAGVHVVYGLVGLKTHAKISLVVREEHDGIRRYAHVGTGNYNSKTARLYEDLGMLTADEELGADLTELFNVLTGYSLQQRYRCIVTAPHRMRDHLLEEIAAETRAGADGAITIKVNSLVDPACIDALYEASAAGVEVDLIVRGISCIRPGIEGRSERIRVRSILGRYLEHSRIYRFGRAPREVRHLIGSADAMPRNLDRRVEALAPVHDPAAKARLDEVLECCLADDVGAWVQTDDRWDRVPTSSGVSVQARLQEMAEARRAR